MSSSLKLVAPFMGLKELPDLPSILKETVKKLNAKNYDKLNFIHFDPTKNPELETEADEYSLIHRDMLVDKIDQLIVCLHLFWGYFKSTYFRER